MFWVELRRCKMFLGQWCFKQWSCPCHKTRTCASFKVVPVCYSPWRQNFFINLRFQWHNFKGLQYCLSWFYICVKYIPKTAMLTTAGLLNPVFKLSLVCVLSTTLWPKRKKEVLIWAIILILIFSFVLPFSFVLFLLANLHYSSTFHVIQYNFH